ncbi:MAG: lyase family protein [Verrucomicrobiota bacterium]|nr:lyase family protein [Verrucomicrobiota bacterium]
MPDQLWAKNLPLDEQVHAFTVGDDPIVDRELLPFDIEGSAAHARMLGESGLLPEAEAKALVRALSELRTNLPQITREQEDGHTAIEHALGEPGRRIHLARSRNDQVQTALRLLMRSRLLDLGNSLASCASAFLDFAQRYASAPLPGYTHVRRAMPSSWGMWSVAFAEGLLEEIEQLPALWIRLDRSPLGAAAGFGAPLAINRKRSAELLGFSRVQRSPIDVMNSRGRHEQALAAWIVSAAGTLEKALCDLLLWSTDEFGFVRLPDAFTTGSSLMPQKRNPDVLELARGRCRKLRGLAALLAQLSGGLPSSYHRDHQLLKAPFLEIVRDGEELFQIVARLIPALEVNEATSAAACTPEIYAAREACRLAADGKPFRDAYAEVAEGIARGTYVAADEEGSTNDLALEELRAQLAQTETWLSARREFLTATTVRLFDWS